MEHSDEMTFAEYFKAQEAMWRGLITFAVVMEWLTDHDFAEMTDKEARLLDIEVSRQMCEAWGDILCFPCWNGRTANNSGPSADCDAAGNDRQLF